MSFVEIVGLQIMKTKQALSCVNKIFLEVYVCAIIKCMPYSVCQFLLIGDKTCTVLLQTTLFLPISNILKNFFGVSFRFRVSFH